MTESKRVVLDCRKEGKGDCSVAISGTENEVIELAEYHVTSKHGFEKKPELRAKLRSFLKEESLAR